VLGDKILEEPKNYCDMACVYDMFGLKFAGNMDFLIHNAKRLVAINNKIFDKLNSYTYRPDIKECCNCSNAGSDACETCVLSSDPPSQWRSIKIKDTECPKCKSENITLEDDFYENEDGEMEECGDRWNGHCNDCGHDFILVSI